MKTLFILATVVFVFFLAAPNSAEAQKKTPKTLTKIPRPQATEAVSWVKTNFPSGVDTFTAEFAFNASGHIFVGTDKGVYRSTDNGASWIPINNGLKPNSSGSLTVFALAINSRGHIFAAIWDQIYLSTDSGNNWTQQSDLGDGNGAYGLAISPEGHLFAGTGEGVFCSTDNGVTWTAKNLGLVRDGDDRNGTHAVIFNQNGDIFAGTFEGVYRSSDKGENWTQKLGDASNNAFLLAISPNGSVFTQLNSNQSRPTGDEGLYRSTNNGNKWTRLKKGGDVIAFNSSGHIFLGDVGKSAGVYRSTNNGNSWTNISKGLVLGKANTDKRVSALAISPNGIMFAVTPAGVFRSK